MILFISCVINDRTLNYDGARWRGKDDKLRTKLFIRRHRKKLREAYARAKFRGQGFLIQRVPVSFFRIASLPTIRKEDLMRINSTSDLE
jgi:hypothetical protein